VADIALAAGLGLAAAMTAAGLVQPWAVAVEAGACFGLTAAALCGVGEGEEGDESGEVLGHPRHTSRLAGPERWRSPSRAMVRPRPLADGEGL